MKKKELSSFKERLELSLPQAEDAEEAYLEESDKEVNARSQVPISITEAMLSDLGAIQRNFMPKAKRLQLSGWGESVASDVLYKTYGFGLRAGYHLNESWGVELSGTSFSSSKSTEAKDLESVQLASLSNVATIANQYSLLIHLSKIYGKLAFFDRQIIPFEFYQYAGVGQVTDLRGLRSSSINLGLGQMFTLNRSQAFRLELSALNYQARTVDGQQAPSTLVLLQFGIGQFFPEPVYR